MGIQFKIQERVIAAVDAKTFPGCVIGSVRISGERLVLPFGTITYEGAENVTEDTVYDLASITKSIPTASLALLFHAEKKLDLTDPVTRHIPELQNDQGATIEDLLRYRVRGPRLSALPYTTFEEIRTHVFESGLERVQDGAFTNVPAYLLGLVVERVGDAALAELAHRYFFEPLKMTHTTFFPSASDCAPTEVDERGEVRDLPHDESAYLFAKARRSVGHAGLFSTGGDMIVFLEALLRNQYPDIVGGAESGLGWQLNQPYFMGAHALPRTFGKTGFTGTSVVIDRQKEVAFVVLSNRTYPHRPPDAASDTSAINMFRSDIADIILGNF